MVARRVGRAHVKLGHYPAGSSFGLARRRRSLRVLPARLWRRAQEPPYAAHHAPRDLIFRCLVFSNGVPGSRFNQIEPLNLRSSSGTGSSETLVVRETVPVPLGKAHRSLLTRHLPKIFSLVEAPIPSGQQFVGKAGWVVETGGSKKDGYGSALAIWRSYFVTQSYRGGVLPMRRQTRLRASLSSTGA
jgi:hypothetical protein